MLPGGHETKAQERAPGSVRFSLAPSINGETRTNGYILRSIPVTGWLKARLNTKWLVKTRMEPSAREALVTTFGYVAVAIAVMVALSSAGIGFSNLAVIAGPMSSCPIRT